VSEIKGLSVRAGTAPALTLSGLSKTFQGQQALRSVELQLERGEIHALLGQNGSGKSTLIKILAGYHTPDPGSSGSLFGEPLDLASHMAQNHGDQLRFIHQDLGFIDTFSVAENMSLLGSYPHRRWVSDRGLVQWAQEILDSYGVGVDASLPVSELGLAARTLVAVVRAVHFGSGTDSILVLDEPTAALADSDKHLLFDLLRQVRDRGQSVLYVTHLLQEVFELGDRVTILRNGSVVAARPVDGLDHDSLVELILGRKLDALYPENDESPGVAVLEIEGLRGANVHDLSLTVRAGEIVGIVGLVGSGAENVPHLVFGSQERDAGTVTVGGKTVAPGSPSAAIKAGMAFSPGERKRLALLGDWSIRENITLPRIRGRGPMNWLSARFERADVTPYMRSYDVVPADPEVRVASLSGGNQQKVVIARWMRSGASVFVLEEPTAGVDVGAKRAIYDALVEAAGDGSAVLISTSDFDEAASLCDRVLVMRGGVVGASVPRAEATSDRLLMEAITLPAEKDKLDV
jgi:ribose transport system ATP-binding protein